jgi:hypothetical protein
MGLGLISCARCCAIAAPPRPSTTAIAEATVNSRILMGRVPSASVIHPGRARQLTQRRQPADVRRAAGT